MSEAPDFVLFLGRFHPLIVHLPIGFLLFAFVLEILGRQKKYKAITAAIPLALLLGFLSAFVACVLGYMLSLSGDYEEGMLDNHFWFGVITTGITLIACLIRTEKIKIKKKVRIKANISALTLIVILISITGHYGGNLTHGSDYLTKYLPFSNKEKKELVKVDKIEDAVIFAHLAEPILDNKCASCHNESKQKGGLSFQDSLSIFKGGKSGSAIVAGNSSQSEMIKRVLLDPEHEDFMPPDGKTPLTEEEIAILQYWIDNAEGNFSTKMGDLETPESLLNVASNMLGLEGGTKKGEVALPSASKISEDVLQDIMKEGFTLRELVFDSHIYEVVLPKYNMHMGDANLQTKVDKLSKIKDNIIWLYIEDNELSDSNLETIGSFKNLQKLVINRNPISDNGIAKLKNLNNLSSINVYGTNISKQSLDVLSSLNNLKTVYAWKTKITDDDITSYPTDKLPSIIVEP
ncbi:MAG: c-type cytochrome domain-containing protein [Jejuia sp.]